MIYFILQIRENGKFPRFYRILSNVNYTDWSQSVILIIRFTECFLSKKKKKILFKILIHRYRVKLHRSVRTNSSKSYQTSKKHFSCTKQYGHGKHFFFVFFLFFFSLLLFFFFVFGSNAARTIPPWHRFSFSRGTATGQYYLLWPRLLNNDRFSV